MHTTMDKIFHFLLAFVVLEVLSILLFKFIKKLFVKNNRDIKVKKSYYSYLKGTIERFMLVIGFIAGIPTI